MAPARKVMPWLSKSRARAGGFDWWGVGAGEGRNDPGAIGLKQPRKGHKYPIQLQSLWERAFVGAELARDEGATVYSRTAIARIASKLGSHNGKPLASACSRREVADALA
ncbi:hypothetical protein AO356_25120 [Pseudomonas fluorescens]|uniref:Uncharacterized protein n=1 Tax=Pseudomonas fluorescens TaxID=294 RepID=A0A0N9WCA5_PSEFL|nr:hypothetical protein AO356_25120 [Pseudomonas fluorescens]